MGKKILVVDDEADIVDLITLRLVSCGYEVASAFDGEEAVNKVKSEKPDLIILDFWLPKMNGYEVSQHLKMHKEYKDIPIIMLTARKQAGRTDEIRRKDIDAYLNKPFRADVLLSLIKGLLRDR